MSAPGHEAEEGRSFSMIQLNRSGAPMISTQSITVVEFSESFGTLRVFDALKMR